MIKTKKVSKSNFQIKAINNAKSLIVEHIYIVSITICIWVSTKITL